MLQPEFAHGWFERGRFDRPFADDDEGNEIEEEASYEVGIIEQNMAHRAWRERRKALGR